MDEGSSQARTSGPLRCKPPVWPPSADLRIEERAHIRVAVRLVRKRMDGAITQDRRYARRQGVSTGGRLPGEQGLALLLGFASASPGPTPDGGAMVRTLGAIT